MNEWPDKSLAREPTLLRYLGVRDGYERGIPDWQRRPSTRSVKRSSPVQGGPR
jgi:hypothetical protein